GIGFSERSNVRRDLAHLLPVDAAHNEPRLFINSDTDARWNRIFDRMRITEGEDNRIFLLFCAISNADNLQFPREPVRDTSYRVGDQSTSQSMKSPFRSAVTRTDSNELFIFLLPLDSWRNWIGHRSLWSGDNDLIGFDIDFYLIR